MFSIMLDFCSKCDRKCVSMVSRDQYLMINHSGAEKSAFWSLCWVNINVIRKCKGTEPTTDSRSLPEGGVSWGKRPGLGDLFGSYSLLPGHVTLNKPTNRLEIQFSCRLNVSLV